MEEIVGLGSPRFKPKASGKLHGWFAGYAQLSCNRNETRRQSKCPHSLVIGVSPKPRDTPTNAPSHSNPPRIGVEEDQAGSRPKDSSTPAQTVWA